MVREGAWERTHLVYNVVQCVDSKSPTLLRICSVHIVAFPGNSFITPHQRRSHDRHKAQRKASVPGNALALLMRRRVRERLA